MPQNTQEWACSTFLFITYNLEQIKMLVNKGTNFIRSIKSHHILLTKSINLEDMKENWVDFAKRKMPNWKVSYEVPYEGTFKGTEFVGSIMCSGHQALRQRMVLQEKSRQRGRQTWSQQAETALLEHLAWRRLRVFRAVGDTYKCVGSYQEVTSLFNRLIWS